MSNPTSVTGLENDIALSRDRLARTIDELADRAAPKNVVARQKASAQRTVRESLYTADGSLRTERVAAAAVAVGAIVLLKVLRSRRNRW